MSFVAIMKGTLSNRVAKYRPFLTESEADAHVVLFLGKYPQAFVSLTPAEPIEHWLVDMVAKTISIVPPPPPDFTAKDQAAVDALLLDSGVMRAFALTMFEIGKAGKTGDWSFFDGVTNVATFKTLLKGLIR